MKYYLGIDGGGTKTVCAVSDELGKILIKVTGKSINFYSVGMDAARKNLNDIINEIKASLGNILFESAFIGCSALDCEADEKLIHELCDGIIFSNKIKMNSDTYIALKSLGDIPCPAIAICGTGSMAMGEDSKGKLHISGGWGHILGDEGSAYSIALSALKECCKINDGESTTSLINSTLEYFNIKNYRDIINIIYSEDTSKDVIAGFAVTVCELSTQGDKLCNDIINKEAVKFAETVKTLLYRLNGCKILGLYGGVFKNNTKFRVKFLMEINNEFPHIDIKLTETPPEEAAVYLARKLK